MPTVVKVELLVGEDTTGDGRLASEPEDSIEMERHDIGSSLCRHGVDCDIELAVSASDKLVYVQHLNRIESNGIRWNQTREITHAS